MMESTLTLALTQWVDAVTGREVVFDELPGAGPKDGRPVCAIKMANEPQTRGVIERKPIVPAPDVPEPDMEEVSTVEWHLFVSMNLLGGATHEDMRKLRTAVVLSRWRDHFAAAGLGFASVGRDNDISQVIDSDWESRLQADWGFTYCETVREPHYSIERATFINQLPAGKTFTVEA